jgi:ATP-binding cassette, subfamily B, bacterial
MLAFLQSGINALRARLSSKRIPYVQQVTATDCGAACLAMVLAFRGKVVALRELRNAIGAHRDGATAGQIVRVAERFGLSGKGFRIQNVSDLQYVPLGSILHWNRAHYVVLESSTAAGAWIVDPAMGRRFVGPSDLDASLSGVVLQFTVSDDFVRSRHKPQVQKHYLRALLSLRSDLVGIVLASVLAQLAALSIPISAAILINVALPREDSLLIGMLGLLGAAVVLFVFLSSWIRAAFIVRLKGKLDIELTTGFLMHLLKLPYEYYQERSSGDLVMRLNSNTEIREILSTQAIASVLDGMIVFVYLVLLFIAHPPTAGLVFLLAISQSLVFLLLQHRQARLMGENLETRARARSVEYQIVANAEMVKGAGAEEQVMHRWLRVFGDNINVVLSQGRLETISTSVLDSTRVAGSVILLVYAASAVITGSMQLGTMVALVMLALAILMPISQLVSTALSLKQLGSYFERLGDVLLEPIENSGKEARGGVLRSPRGAVDVDGLEFRYKGTRRPVIQRLTMKVPEGNFVAIVGRSGSGKSTLAKLLAGLYQPNAGQIRIDGVCLSDLNLTAYRRAIGYVPQQPSFFDTTIENNIRMLSPMVTDDDIVNAIDAACLREDIENMPMGIRTMLSEGGSSFSGGQRQRLALAIMLARRPELLVLDEATSALDSLTERRIQNNLSDLHCTRIVIAHRLSTIMDADMIFVMDEGQFVEQGSHDDLVARDGYYANLLRQQVSAPQHACSVASR